MTGFQDGTDDGLFASFGDQAGIVGIWDVGMRKKVQRLLAPTEAVFAVTFSQDGKYVLTGGGGGRSGTPQYVRVEDNNSIALWDVQTGRPLKRFVGPSHAVWGLAFLLDGTCVISVSRGKTIRRWTMPQ